VGSLSLQFEAGEWLTPSLALKARHWCLVPNVKLVVAVVKYVHSQSQGFCILRASAFICFKFNFVGAI